MHEGVPVSQAWLWRIIAPRHKSRRDQPFNVETHLLRWTSDNLPQQRGGELSADDGSDLRGSFGRAQKVQPAVEARLQGRRQSDRVPRQTFRREPRPRRVVRQRISSSPQEKGESHLRNPRSSESWTPPGGRRWHGEPESRLRLDPIAPTRALIRAGRQTNQPRTADGS